jgi:phosphohistidine phosphatase
VSRSGGAGTIQLHLLRHADAGDPAAWEGDDFGRPLSGKGERQAERLGTFLAAHGFAADVIVTSPRARALQTAEIVGDRLGIAVRVDDRLGAAFGLAAIDAILADAGAPSRPILVGHDPTFTDIVRSLVGSEALSLKKGALVRIDVRPPVAGGAAALRWLLPPEILDPSRS